MLRVGDLLLVNGHRLREELVGNVLLRVEAGRAELIDNQEPFTNRNKQIMYYTLHIPISYSTPAVRVHYIFQKNKQTVQIESEDELREEWRGVGRVRDALAALLHALVHLRERLVRELQQLRALLLPLRVLRLRIHIWSERKYRSVHRCK